MAHPNWANSSPHRQPDLGEPAIAAAITLHELTETADLLHILAGRSTEDLSGDNEPVPQPEEAST